jgi:hypothetical protein
VAALAKPIASQAHRALLIQVVVAVAELVAEVAVLLLFDMSQLPRRRMQVAALKLL